MTIPAVTTDTVIYDTVGPPNHTSGKADLEVANIAYTKTSTLSDNIKADLEL